MDNTTTNPPTPTTPAAPETATPVAPETSAAPAPTTTAPTNPSMTPGTSPAAAPSAGATPPPSEKKPLSKFIIVLVVLIFLVLLGVGGYLMLAKPASPTPITALPTATPTVTMSPEENEVNAIDTGSSESSDLNGVQSDVNSLTTPSPSPTK